MLPCSLPLKCVNIMADDIRENAMAGGTPARLRGLDANGNSISPTLEEVMNAMGIYTYSFTLAAKEEKDLGDLGYGMYLLASPNNAATAIFAFGSYSKGFGSDAGSNFYCDYTDGTKGVAFGRKTTNGSFFIKNRHKAQRNAKFYINKCRSASCMQGGLKQASA